MSIEYTKLFAKMKEEGLSTYRIRKEKIIGERTLQALRENRVVNTDTIETFCRIFHCQPGDLMEYVEDPSNEQEHDS